MKKERGTSERHEAGARPVRERQDQVLKGIVYMCLSAMLLPFLNAAAKQLLHEGFPVVQVVWARYAIHLLFVLAVFAPRRGWRLLSTSRPGVQLTRSSLLLACTCLYFTALRFIELPTAAAINFTAPIIVTLLAIPMLGEKVGWRRMLAVCFGFAGAMVIIRPGTGETHPAGFLVLGTASLYALYQILTRRVAGFDPPDTSVTYMAVVGTIAVTLALPWWWHSPESLRGWLLLLSTGCVAAVGHFFVVKALDHAPASVVSPFHYGQLLGAAALGYLFFDHVPDRWVWIGAAMVVGSGLFITYRESALAQRRSAAARLRRGG